MCGIAGGWWHFDEKERLLSALRKIRHRGPDDEGYELYTLKSSIVGLGHTRLSIIDLTHAGHQPMQTLDGRYAIVFNGEIYNYRELRVKLKKLGYSFRSDSDTEVLLAAWAEWGVSVIPRLKGMFAFVVLDKIAGTITCVRDAFGIKPLFYCVSESGFSFASEISALLELLPASPKLNIQRAYDYLVWNSYDEGAATFYEGIQHLEPGHWLRFELGNAQQVSIERWWWPSIEESCDLSFDQAAEKLQELFLDSIRLHLRSDMPVGAALSGGLDSSAVVCAMRKVEPILPIHTFTYVARGSNADEEKWADLINQHVGAIPHKVSPTFHNLAHDLDDMLQTQGEPFTSTSIYAQYRVFKLVRETGIAVTLDGQGADELLGGYQGYPGQRMHSLVDNREYLRLGRFMRDWSRWPDRNMSQAVRSILGQYTPNRFRASGNRLLGRDSLRNCLDVKYIEETAVQRNGSPVVYSELYKGRRLMATLRNAMTGGALQPLLRHGDRNSMRWSVESRVPFLTTELAEFTLSLPERYLVADSGESKSIFRKALRGIVPDEILDRKDKIGFATPESDWLRPLGVQIKEWMEPAQSSKYLNQREVSRIIDDYLEGNAAYDNSVWRLINFSRWLQVNGVS